MTSSNKSRHYRIAPLTTSLCTLLVFSRVIFNDFRIWDDDSHIYQNPTLQALSWDNLINILTNQSHSTCFYTPLTGFRWSLTYHWGGLDPLWFHLGNLLFHTANTAMIFFLITALVMAARGITRQEGDPSPKLVIAAALGSLVWSLHPLRVEAVAGAVCGAHEQALFFGLISLLCYLKYIEAEKRLPWFVISCTAYLASLTSQPILLGLPVMLMVLDFYPLKRIGPFKGLESSEGYTKVLLEKIPYLAIAVIIFSVNLTILPHAALPGHPLATLTDFGILDRAMQAFYIWAYYLWRPFFPVDLAPLYTTLIQFNPIAFPFLAGAFIVLGVTGLLIYKRRVWPALLAAWLCHLILLIPFLGLTEHPHYPADRYSLAVAIIPAMLLAGWMINLTMARFAKIISALIIVIVMLGILTISQTEVWENTITLGNQILKVTSSEPGHPYRARIYRRMALHHLAKEEYGQAETYMNKALEITPQEYQYTNLLALLIIKQNRPAEAEVILKELTVSRPDKTDAPYNLAQLLIELQRYEEALTYVQMVLQRQPGNGTAKRLGEEIQQRLISRNKGR